MSTANSSSALPTTLLTTITSAFPSDISTSSIYPTATTTLYFNSTCNTTLSYNTTTSLNTTSLICNSPSSGNSFPYWIFYLWPLDLALLFVAGVTIYLFGLIIIAMFKSGCCGLFTCIGKGARGVGNGVGKGVGSVKRGVGRKVGETREWNEERIKKARERREERLRVKRGTIALEAI